MSIAKYNGVILPYAFITQLRQNVIYDDKAQTDPIYTQFDVTVQCVLNANYLATVAPSLVGKTTNPADIMNTIRSTLLQPRQRFSLVFNGVELIPQNIGPGFVDAMNGPKPQSCILTTITNTTFLLTYHIIANYHECNTPAGQLPVTNQAGSDVLYNRWTERVEIDAANHSKRIREGKFIIRSDNVDAFIADQLRTQFAIVAVPQGFLRESSTYAVSPDGLAIEYTIVDKEPFKLPPSPAFEADGDYMETAANYGARRFLEARVRLKGSKTTDQTTLIERAIQVAASKVYVGSLGFVQGATIPESAAVQVKLYENVVECRVRAVATPGATSGGSQGRVEGIWGFSAQNLAFTPGSETGQAPTPPYTARGSAGLLLQAAAYYDPCLRAGNSLRTTDGLPSTGALIGTAGQDPEGQNSLRTGPDAPGDNSLTGQMGNTPIATITTRPINTTDNTSKFRTFTPNSIFTDYEIHCHYEKDRHVYMMGITSPAGFQGNSTAFCQLASPTLLWVVDFTASKFNAQPEIPDPGNVPGPWILMDDWYEPVMITVGPDGVTPLYRISGTYVFGNLNPLDPTVQNIKYPKPPWLEDVFDRTQPLGTLNQNLIT